MMDAALFNWPGRPKNPLLDPLQQYWPWRRFACRWLLRGEVPLWNPHSFSGYPFLANLQSAILYPPNLIFLPFASRTSPCRKTSLNGTFPVNLSPAMIILATQKKRMS